MRYLPYQDLRNIPNIIVDGAANESTLLTLSHWPHSRTPWPLKDDLSAQIVFRYLDQPEFHVDVDAVSNNHFDEDGLISLFTMLHPQEAQQKRELLIDIASAGDFGTYRSREAVRIAFVLSAFADPKSSPLPSTIFSRSYPETTACLYEELLGRLPDMLEHAAQFIDYWQAAERDLISTEESIQKGSIRIEEIPALGLAVVTLPEGERDCHVMAVNNATRCFAVLQMAGRRYEFRYRYETWVQYISSLPLPRADLSPLAERLSDLEGSRWEFEGVDTIVPRLYLRGVPESRISPQTFRTEVEAFLATAPPAWDPFDSPGPA